MSVILQRRSVRQYKDKAVSDELINKLLVSAMQAPSAMNQQPWEFIVVKDKNTLTEMSKVSKGAWMLAQAPLCITVVLKEDKSVMAPQDLGACVQNILLEAVNQGLGAVWIGVYPREERCTKINELLHITKGTAFANIAIGYPKENKDVTLRFDPSRIHYEKMD